MQHVCMFTRDRVQECSDNGASSWCGRYSLLKVAKIGEYTIIIVLNGPDITDE